MKRAIINGITGQDGSYMTEFLLSSGYEVHGIISGSNTQNDEYIDRIYLDRGEHAGLHYHSLDIQDSGQLTKLIYDISPDEVYYFGPQGRTSVRYDMHEFSGDITGLSSSTILEAVRQSGVKCRFCHTSSSEIFGSTPSPQSEASPFRPHNPYACAKLMSHLSAVNYREAYGIFASNAILFNHESPRRGEIFVSRKITSAVARIKACDDKYLILGDLKPERDWGYAPEYVEMMWKMLENDAPSDYVFGTGVTHKVGDFVEEAFAYAGLDWKDHVRIDPRYFRAPESPVLKADSSRAERDLGWRPRISFSELVRIMVDADIRALGLTPPGEGDRILSEKFPGCWWKKE
jgi:GDPmannose 4,6-dehydratase